MAASCRTLEPEERASGLGLLTEDTEGGDGEPTPGEWHWRRTRTGVVKVALGLTAVLLVVAASTLLAPAELSNFAGKVGLVSLSEESEQQETKEEEPKAGEEEPGVGEKEPKAGYHFETVCGTDYKLLNVVHNNFGGKGPDSGDKGIVYNASETKDGEFVRYILVKLNALSPYESESSKSNGMYHDFGTIRIDSGDNVDVRFSFFNEEDKELTMDVIRITVYDLDEASGNTAKEYVIEEGAKVNMTQKTDVETDDLKAGTKIEATHVGNSADNPTFSTQLTKEQMDKAVVLTYRKIHHADITMGSTTGKSTRMFAFALHSALSCRQVEVKDEESGTQIAYPAGGSLMAVVVASLLVAFGRLG
jgi:hypothetical protein